MKGALPARFASRVCLQAMFVQCAFSIAAAVCRASAVAKTKNERLSPEAAALARRAFERARTRLRSNAHDDKQARKETRSGHAPTHQS